MEALYGDRVDVRLELYFVVEDCLHEILDNNVTSFRFAVESVPEQGIYTHVYAIFIIGNYW